MVQIDDNSPHELHVTPQLESEHEGSTFVNSSDKPHIGLSMARAGAKPAKGEWYAGFAGPGGMRKKFDENDEVVGVEVNPLWGGMIWAK